MKLSRSLFPINETISRIGYIADAAAIDYESVEGRNLNAVLAKLATANLNKQRIQTFNDSKSNSTSTTSADFEPTDVSHLLHNSFFFMLLSSNCVMDCSSIEIHDAFEHSQFNFIVYTLELSHKVVNSKSIYSNIDI